IKMTINSNSKNLLIEVCDNGVGIPAEELPKIFKEFYRANNVRKIVSEGSGLGLSVVKRIVESYSGKIEVESEYGEGTLFRVYIPSAEISIV
nr:sensor histidine kinase [Ignavibacterium sp.]